MDHKKLINQSLDASNKLVSNLPKDPLPYTKGGMSGIKGRHFLNNIINKYTGCNYLEIGTHVGSTLCSAFYDNKNIGNTYSIDDFSWGGADETVRAENQNSLKVNIKEYIPHIARTHKHFVRDCFSMSPSQKGIKNIDVYFFDAGHSEDDHYNALVHYIDCMSKKFIYIVDDWVGVSGAHVRTGTINAINDLSLTAYLFEERPETYSKQMVAPENPNEWWNGFGIFLLEKPD